MMPVFLYFFLPFLDLGGPATTRPVADAVKKALRQSG
jgi:hypothetical protein